jgi:acetaldehyde dehydrogenase/alcohol dehydrogenase
LQRYAEIADFLGLGGSSDTEKLEKLIAKIDELKEKSASRKPLWSMVSTSKPS